MRFQQCKLDGQDVLRDGNSGILYTKTEWRRLATDEVQELVMGLHRRVVSPTYARTRVITLEWYLDSLGNAEEEDAQYYLEELFALQDDPTTIVPRELYILDNYGNEWVLDVKVKDPIDIVEASGDFVWYAHKWSVTLESIESPVYKSFAEITETGTDGSFGGFPVSFGVPMSMTSYTNLIELVSSGNHASPIRWEIEAVNNFTWPLIIVDVTNTNYMKFEIDWLAGDIIIIDGENYTATKNGVDITWYRTAWSSRLTVKGTQQFAVLDYNGSIPTTDLTVDAFFRNSLL